MQEWCTREENPGASADLEETWWVESTRHNAFVKFRVVLLEYRHAMCSAAKAGKAGKDFAIIDQRSAGALMQDAELTAGS
jgi:hypothetical protein